MITVEHIKADIKELETIISLANRPNVKNILNAKLELLKSSLVIFGLSVNNFRLSSTKFRILSQFVLIFNIQ
jgi:hypothetical protein